MPSATPSDGKLRKNPEQKADVATHLDYIFQLLQKQSEAEYLGESITELEHCLQAAFFASEEADDEESIMATLLHNIGQYLPLSELEHCHVPLCRDETHREQMARQGHDTFGQFWLESHGWPPKVCQLVGAHVNAKRYAFFLTRFLAATEPQYLATLSEASQATLRMHGGPFTPEQVTEFKKQRLYKCMVRLCQWNDSARVVGMKTPDLAHYRPMAERVLQRGLQTA